MAAAIGGIALFAPLTRADDTSPPVILQWFEDSWQTMAKRTPDVFMAGYGAVWTPPPGRALMTSAGGGIGYDVYNRFDLGTARDTTLYGTEKGYKSVVNAVHQFGGDVYVDFVHHHVGSFDIPAYTGPNGGGSVQTRNDYPGFVLSNVGATDGDTYPNPPPTSSGNPAFEYQYRLANLITLNFTSTNANVFVRNPVLGAANNVPQSSANWAVPTATSNAAGTPLTSTTLRQANTPTNDNRRFYTDLDTPGRTITDGGVTYTVHDFNAANPSAGDAVAETTNGYMMRYAQWLIQSVGVDGLRIDAARHVPLGATGDAQNPTSVDLRAQIDRAVFGASTRTNLDGTRRNPFQFQEVFNGDQDFLQGFVRKDINPATPSAVGGNRDVLDFPLWFAMRSNLSNSGTANNWYNIRNSSQDARDDGLSHNGSESIHFVVNHDEGGVYLSNVAHAYTLMQPGNAYVYFKGNGFDRSSQPDFFLKEGRGDALGGLYGTQITKLVDIRNTHGRGNFAERWIDGGGQSGFSNVYVFERVKSSLVALNSALGTTTNFDERGPMQTGFAAGTHLVELTGNADDATVDPGNQIPNTVVVNSSGQVTLRIPRNQNTNGVEHGRGYVIYGLQTPQGTVAVTNVSQTLAAETPTAATNSRARLTPIDVVTSNSFNVTLNTNAVTLSDGYRDTAADGNRAYLKFDGGVDLNNNGTIDYASSATSNTTKYGFENFVTTNTPGTTSGTGVGTYTQAIDTTKLSEGYHYITARAFRLTAGTDPEIYRDFRKVIYVDRLAPQSTVASFAQSGATSATREIQVTSLDGTANAVNAFVNLPAATTDAQILAMVGAGNKSDQIDTDTFALGVGSVASGNNVITTVTYEVTGRYKIDRTVGVAVNTIIGSGLGDTNFTKTFEAADVGSFETTLYSKNTQFNPAADLNGDGRVDNIDFFSLPAFYAGMGASSAVTAEARAAVVRRGDLNGSSTTDAADIDRLYARRGATGDVWLEDLNVDGTVTNADVGTLVHTILATEFGDTNLDRSIETVDFAKLLAGFGTTSAGWAKGDFDGTTTVTSTDFNILIANYGFLGAATPSAVPGAVLPEPAALGVVFSLALAARRRRSSL